MQGFGHELPEMFETSAQWSDTSHSRGRVMNGLGTGGGEFHRDDGLWQTHKYWTPAGFLLEATSAALEEGAVAGEGPAASKSEGHRNSSTATLTIAVHGGCA